jgi:hypothetical protein
MSEIDSQCSQLRLKEVEVNKMKNQILKRLTNPKVIYPVEDRPAQKKLSQSDFFVYNDFPHNKNIKITGEGLILANYIFS